MHVASLSLLLLLAAAPGEVGLLEDKGDLFIRAGTASGVKMGMEVKLLGDKIGDTTERRVVGTAIVMEVWDSLARIAPDDEARKAKPQAAKLVTDAPKAKARAAAAPKTAAASARAAAPAAAPAERQSAKGTSAAMGFSDHLSASCAGAQIDVFGKSTLLGGMVRLMINGTVAGEDEVRVGGTLMLNGKAGGKPVVLHVSQGMFGTDYVVRVDGKPCELTNL